MLDLRLFRLRAFTAGNSRACSAPSAGRPAVHARDLVAGIWLPEHGYNFANTPARQGYETEQEALREYIKTPELRLFKLILSRPEPSLRRRPPSGRGAWRENVDSFRDGFDGRSAAREHADQIVGTMKIEPADLTDAG